MVLTDIFECTILVVVATASSDPKVFSSSDLNLADVLFVHEMFEDAVAKTESQDILECFFA